MKLMNFKVALMCASLVLFAVACDDDDDDDDATTDTEAVDDDDAAVDSEDTEDETTEATVTITFEDATLGDEGYLTDQAYTESGYVFSNNYSSYEYDGYTYTSWDGYAISSLTDKKTVGYTNQYSVYADGGCDGSSKFAIAYYSEYSGVTTYIKREDGATFTPYSAYLCLTTYTYWSIVSGDDYATAFASGDYFNVIVTGYDADGSATGSVTIPVADYTGSELELYDEWTECSLSDLGEVSSIAITMESTDTITYDGETYYMNTPSYIAIDNLVLSE